MSFFVLFLLSFDTLEKSMLIKLRGNLLTFLMSVEGNMKEFRFLVVLPFLLSMLLFSACAPVKEVRKEVGTLNLNYSFPDGELNKTNFAIAIVSPDFIDKKFSNNADASDFNVRFYKDYAERLKIAFTSAFQELISKKGFNIKGPFASFDDLTYNEKKEAYFSLVPTMNVTIENLNTQWRVDSGVYTREGVIQISGELRLDFIEPMTREKILVQRINLSSFNIKKPFKSQTKFGQPQNLTESIIYSLKSSIDSAFKPSEELEDTSDKALADACNEFFKKSMERIWEFVSTEELLRYRDQVRGLKALKRF